jgi:hypothetical protein
VSNAFPSRNISLFNLLNPAASLTTENESIRITVPSGNVNRVRKAAPLWYKVSPRLPAIFTGTGLLLQAASAIADNNSINIIFLPAIAPI